MIEITHTTPKKEEKGKIRSSKHAPSVRKSGHSFSSELEMKLGESVEGNLEEMLGDLTEREKRFLQQQTYEELLRYKTLIKKILKTIQEMAFETKSFKRRRRDRADFTVIQKIDEKLLEITRSITDSNKAFNLLKSIEEIRGLIFDLIY